MSSFENLRVVDNFYQTSLFFPMPTVVISTLCEDGTTTLGPYSLVQPYYVAGKDFYAMLLFAGILFVVTVMYQFIITAARKTRKEVEAALKE